MSFDRILCSRTYSLDWLPLLNVPNRKVLPGKLRQWIMILYGICSLVIFRALLGFRYKEFFRDNKALTNEGLDIIKPASELQ